MIRPLLVATTTLLIALPARAAQEHAAVTLTYLPSRDTIALCPEARYLENEVHVRLGYELFQPSATKHLTVTIARASGGFRSVGEMVDDDGTVVFTQTYPAVDCTFAVFSMAVGIAIKFIQFPESKPPPPGPTEPVPAPPSPPPPVSPPLAPPKRAYRIAVGADAIFAPVIAPGAGAGFAVWAGIDLLDVPLSFEVDLRSSWSLVPARMRLTYQPLFTVRSAYVSGVIAGCWRKWAPVSLCPVLEIGRMSFSRADTIGEALHPSIVVAAGLRGVYTRPIGESLFLRGMFEAEYVPQPFSILDYKGREGATASSIALTWGVGFGGSL